MNEKPIFREFPMFWDIRVKKNERNRENGTIARVSDSIKISFSG